MASALTKIDQKGVNHGTAPIPGCGLISLYGRCWSSAFKRSAGADLLHRLGFVYKKPKRVPGKADPKAQEAFLAEYEKLKQDKGGNDIICFMDAVHPQHNTVLGYGFIKRGEDHQVKSNTGRRRVNINGVIDLEHLEPVTCFDETIDATSTIALFQQLEQVYAVATWIYVICDNARYYRSKAIQDYIKNSRIQLIFLSLYAQNLNLIERL